MTRDIDDARRGVDGEARGARRDDGRRGEAGRVEREAKCRGTLEALNAQFAAWIARRAIESPIVSWRRGCEDYLKHLDRVKVRERPGDAMRARDVSLATRRRFATRRGDASTRTRGLNE